MAKKPTEVLTTEAMKVIADLKAERDQLEHHRDESDDIEGEIKELKERIVDLKVQLTASRDDEKSCEKRLLTYCDELAMLVSCSGERPAHISPLLESASPDPADKHSLHELVLFGLSPRQVEKLEESQLATEVTMRSVGDLVRAIDKDAWWHKKVRGWGEAAIERCTDALTAYRKKHPVPDGDTRQKQCVACQARFDQSIEICPQCHSIGWTLVTPGVDEPEPAVV